MNPGLLRQTAVIIHPGTTTDRANNAQPDWAHTTQASYPCRLEPTATTEVTIGRDTVISDWILYLPPDAVVTAYDRVVVEARTFEVIGIPARADTPRDVDHFEARLRYLEG